MRFQSLLFALAAATAVSASAHHERVVAPSAKGEAPPWKRVVHQSAGAPPWKRDDAPAMKRADARAARWEARAADPTADGAPAW
ncbi:hypothetical protein FB451DRAFT_1390353 [Mycena latifolia]|nr:hypothetical protein FB451DRAFT_1390353 [Mycena latifolia]